MFLRENEEDNLVQCWLFSDEMIIAVKTASGTWSVKKLIPLSKRVRAKECPPLARQEDVSKPFSEVRGDFRYSFELCVGDEDKLVLMVSNLSSSPNYWETNDLKFANFGMNCYIGKKGGVDFLYC